MQEDKNKSNLDLDKAPDSNEDFDLDEDSQVNQDPPFIVILLVVCILFMLCWITCRFIFGKMV